TPKRLLEGFVERCPPRRQLHPGGSDHHPRRRSAQASVRRPHRLAAANVAVEGSCRDLGRHREMTSHLRLAPSSDPTETSAAVLGPMCRLGDFVGQNEILRTQRNSRSTSRPFTKAARHEGVWAAPGRPTAANIADIRGTEYLKGLVVPPSHGVTTDAHP